MFAFSSLGLGRQWDIAAIELMAGFPQLSPLSCSLACVCSLGRYEQGATLSATFESYSFKDTLLLSTCFSLPITLSQEVESQQSFGWLCVAGNGVGPFWVVPALVCQPRSSTSYTPLWHSWVPPNGIALLAPLWEKRRLLWAKLH